MQPARFARQARVYGLLAAALATVITAALSRPARGQGPATPTASAASVPSRIPTTPVPSIAPTPDAWPLKIDSGAAGLWQTLLKLHTRASLLLVTAHPDDENAGGGMLAYETRGLGTRAAIMTLNRGEGGQNVMSDDYWDALGLVRTEELLAADRYSGAEQYWGSEVDFGFSKSREEALAQWGHDRVLADVVRVVRMTRPLVILSVFVGGPSDGHGHHSVAGQMAQEAFDAAGDPNMFPEQIREGLRPWSPLKMYARTPVGAVSEKGLYDSATERYLPVRFYDFIEKKWDDGVPATTLQIPGGTFSPVLGETFLQIEREGLALQKSQNGGGAVPFAGPQQAPFHRYASRMPAGDKEQSFFDGVDVSLAGIAELAHGQDDEFLKEGMGRVNSLVEQAMGEFAAARPDKIAPELADGLKQTNALAAQVSASTLSEQAKYDVLRELGLKQEQFQHAIVLALGISLDATAGPKHAPGGRNFFNNGPPESFANAIPGQEFAVTVHLDNPQSSALTLNRVWLETPGDEKWTDAQESPAPAAVPAGAAIDQRIDTKVPDDAKATRPYFTRPNDEQPYYDILDARYRNLSLAPYPLAAWAEFNYQGVPVRLGQVVQTMRRENGQGVVLNPLMITPAVSVRIAPQAGITPLGKKSFALSALVHSEATEGSKGTVRLQLPPGWRAEPETAQFSVERAGEEQNVGFQVFPDRLEEKPYTVTALAESGGREYREGFKSTGYSGLRPYNLYLPATYRTSGVNVKVAQGLRVGYVTGTGDDVPSSLENIGIKTEFLSRQDLAQGDLQKFDVIVLGVRAYAARPELATNNSRLLDYVKNGGVMVIQYNTGEYDHNYGPYPLSVPNNAERVVDETSAMQFLDAKSPVLNWPNQITPKDFTGWVEERGHGFVKSWDAHYEAPLETHDTDQDPQKGGLVYAKYGKGVYAYVAFALYRQLPDGVPGAYRLFANLLSLPRNPAFRQAAATPGSNTPKQQ
jgi:LmbE family N-acetylglucosaminyl deacetylase